MLSEFRARVAGGGLDQVVLETLLERLAAGGLVGAGGKMRTDSTHVISAVRDLNRLELAGESVRACLEALAVAAPQVVAQLLDDSWSKRYAARIDTWRMPASETNKTQLALAYRRDGHTLLKAVHAAAGSDPDLAFLARLHQVEVLRVVLLQNYLAVEDDQGREVIRRREADAEGLPPGRSRITSPYDLDARWGVKRDTFWNAYKVHVTETSDTRATADNSSNGDGEAIAPPHLITNVETTDATVPDSQMTEPIHARLAGRGLLPAEHYVDSGYPRRNCWCPRWPASASRWSPRCWPIPHHRPGQVPGSTAPRFPSTSTPGKPPARKTTPAAPGTRSPSVAPTRS